MDFVSCYLLLCNNGYFLIWSKHFKIPNCCLALCKYLMQKLDAKASHSNHPSVQIAPLDWASKSIQQFTGILHNVPAYCQIDDFNQHVESSGINSFNPWINSNHPVKSMIGIRSSITHAPLWDFMSPSSFSPKVFPNCAFEEHHYNHKEMLLQSERGQCVSPYKFGNSHS